MDFKSNILLIPTYGITDQCIGRAAPPAASANSCIDFQSALDQSFSLHDTSARPLLHNYKEEVLQRDSEEVTAMCIFRNRNTFGL